MLRPGLSDRRADGPTRHSRRHQFWSLLVRRESNNPQPVSDRPKTKAQWFDRGARAIALITDGEVEGYACPLCRRVFTNINDLTFEHAPPASVGGGRVALTCMPCNSTSGHTLDASMRSAEDLIEWSQGTPGKSLRARLTVRRVTVNVQAERGEDGGIKILGLPDQNDPKVTAAHREALDELAQLPEDEQEFTVSFPRHKHAESDVQAGWLRAAYLAAFARFGYRYALRPLMEPVRAQIADPSGNHLDRFILHGGAASTDHRMIRSITSPRSARSLIVLMGRHLIFLPGFHADSNTLYERLGRRARWPPPARSLRSLRGPIYEWPTRPILAFDFV